MEKQFLILNSVNNTKDFDYLFNSVLLLLLLLLIFFKY